ARAEAAAELRDHRRGLKPAAGGRRRHHIAGRVDDVEMHGIAAHLAEAADGRLARAQAADRAPLPFLATQLDHRAEALDRPGAQFERSLVTDELAPLVVVGVGKERRHRHLDKVGIAVEFLAIGIRELGALDGAVNEIRSHRIGAIEIEAVEQRQLLRHHRPLGPLAGCACGVFDNSDPVSGTLPAGRKTAAEVAQYWRNRASTDAMVACARSTRGWPWLA